MDKMASQITSLTIVYSTVYSDADQRKHQSSASLAFVRGIHRGPVNSPHTEWPVTRKMFPFDDVIMWPLMIMKSISFHGSPVMMLMNSSLQDVLLNTLRPRRNGQHFADDISKHIFINENIWILINVSLPLVPKGPVNNIPALVQIMAWRLPGNKPLSESMVISLLMHICFTRPQYVNLLTYGKLIKLFKGLIWKDIFASISCTLPIVSTQHWFTQRANQYLSHCWLILLLPYSITRR